MALRYVAVTKDEFVLVKIKTGRWRTKLDEVIVRIPSTGVVAAELGSGVICPLTITFHNGDVWRLEVSGLNKKHAQAVVHALGAP